MAGDTVSVHFDFQPYLDEQYPRINKSGLPAEEIEHAVGLENALADLGTYLRDFQAALMLFGLLRAINPLDDGTRRIVSLQCMSCARAGVFELYHFASSMDAAHESLRSAPSLLAKINAKQRRIAEKLFASFFPSIRQLRNAVAHSGELAGTAVDFNKNKLRKPFDDGFLRLERSTAQNYLNGQKYSRSINGVMVSYELTMASLERLNRAKQVYWSVFQPIAA